MSFGPNPWQQTNWDWRAAGNFIGGGAGSGLVVFALLSPAPHGLAASVLLLAGLALVAIGLSLVWLEIGRPLRAVHVFFNPFTSWMSRESFAAVLLFMAAGAAAAGVAAAAFPAVALALAFVYCQGRLLTAARGIPAWREPRLVPLLLATALAEGGGLYLCLAPWVGGAEPAVWLAFGLVLVARAALWWSWRQRLSGGVAPAALPAIDRAGRFLLLAGSVVPLAAIALAAVLGPSAADAALVFAGLLALVAGARFKFDLVCRAGFNQGFALARLPVRGARR
jgi:phenylacetyl-CoA:acceptor oxidoreductase subunit 2